MADPVIAVGGENLMDQVITDGHMASYPGGSPYNVAFAAARQDAKVHYISPISTDSWGDILATRLGEAGVCLTGGRSDRPTTLARVTICNDTPKYTFQRHNTAERAVDLKSLSPRIDNGVGALHTGSLALNDGPDAQAWEDTLSRAHDRGLLVSVDPNVRLSIIANADQYRARIRRIIAKVHLLKLSDEDLTDLYPDASEADATATVLKTTSATLVILTRGPQGMSAWLHGERLDFPAPPPVSLVDTVGAGDTYMGTILATLALRGALTPKAFSGLKSDVTQDILNRAAKAAALNCQRAGCNPPTTAELDAV